jgi:hypothetical protein
MCLPRGARAPLSVVVMVYLLNQPAAFGFQPLAISRQPVAES